MFLQSTPHLYLFRMLVGYRWLHGYCALKHTPDIPVIFVLNLIGNRRENNRFPFLVR